MYGIKNNRYVGLIVIGVLVVAGIAWMAWDSTACPKCKGQKQTNTTSALSTVQPQKLLVAIDPTYPPMESEGSDGKLIGFDIELAQAIAKELGVDAEFVTMVWDGILTGLVSGNRYDVIISSMNITPDRQKAVDFVPYLKVGQVFVGPKQGAQVKNESDLAGKIVAVLADTTSHSAVMSAQKRGIAVKDIRAYPTATAAFSALAAKHADVVVVDEPVGRHYAQSGSDFAVTGQALPPEPMGIAIRKENAQLRTAIEKVMQTLKENGTLSNLSRKWFGTELTL